MANDFTSNITRKLARIFLKHMESNRIMSKNTDTQLLSGKFNPSSGDTVDFKRPTDYTTVRTSTGDISGSTPDDIETGKASGVVQNYFTSWVDFDEADEAIKMDQIDQLLEPMARRICVDLELDYAAFMMKNAALYAGTIGSAVETWDEVASASAKMKGVGVPMDSPWYYAMNPYTEKKLASNQRSLGAGGAAGSLVQSAHERAMISKNFAGLDVFCGTTLAQFTTHSAADRAGTINGNPDVTYNGAKDTMTQSITVAAFGANLAVQAGDKVTVAGTNQLNLSTRQQEIDEAGNSILWTGTVTTAVTLDGTGAGTIVVTGPAIYETAAGKGAYNTVNRAIVNADVITLLGSASTTYQPNLFWHKQSHGLGFVPIKKLYSTDTLATTKDGLQMRVSKYANGDGNKQTVRFDLRPAYATYDPFKAGHGWGDP